MSPYTLYYPGDVIVPRPPNLVPRPSQRGKKPLPRPTDGRGKGYLKLTKSLQANWSLGNRTAGPRVRVTTRSGRPGR
jgi:hypothetical protein